MLNKHDFEISKADITAVMKKNTAKRTVNDLEKAIQNFDAALDKIPLMFICSKMDTFRAEMLEKIESEKEKILADSQSREEVENEIVNLLNKMLAKIKYAASNNKEYSMYQYGLKGNNVYVHEVYGTPKGVNVSFSHRNKTIMTFRFNIHKGVVDYENPMLSVSETQAKGLSSVIEKNKKHFLEAAKEVDFKKIFEMHFILQHAAMQKDNNVNIHTVILNHFLDKKHFKTAEELISELEVLKDQLDLEKDIKINVLTKKESLKMVA